MGLLSLLSAAVNIGQRISQAITKSVYSNVQKQTISNIKANNGYGSSGGSRSGSGSSSGSSGSGSGSGGSGGSGDGSSSDSTNDNTTKNVIVNDPEKNKLLSEVRMSEELRDTLNITVFLPVILKGLHTNQWFFMDVSDGFYEKNYGDVMKIIANKKYGRYAGFKKGRFFVEKIVEKGGVDGVSMELTLNPLASNYGQYTKMQLEAEKALIDALNEQNKSKGGGGYGSGGAVNVSGSDCSDSKYESHNWGGHKSNPPKCTAAGKVIRGNSNRQYAKDTAAYNSTSKELVEYVKSQCLYQYYANNQYGSARCPEKLWTGSRPIRGNCADYARLLKCILDVNGYKSIICHIPGHFYNAIWENGGWTVCDLCHTPAYGHANHGDIKPIGTWDNPVVGGESDA